MIRSLQDIFTTSRSRILSQLKDRPHTISELSRITGYSKPTLAYHLEKLCETGMVKRVENGRKWVYYELTEKGRRLIRRDIALLIGMLIAALSSFVISAYISLNRFLQKPTIYGDAIERAPLKAPLEVPTVEETPSAIPAPATTPTPSLPPAPHPMPKAPAPYPDQLATILITLGIVMLLLFVLYRKR